MNRFDLSQKQLGIVFTSNIMEDVKGDYFQETGQEQQPARMVGLNVLIWPLSAWKRNEVIHTDYCDKKEKERLI